MTSRLPPQCVTCRRWAPALVTRAAGQTVQSCEAFPLADGGIPAPIWDNEVDHRQSYQRDRGITWESSGDDFPEWAMVGGAAPVAAALGHDVTPGHDQLHHWWVYGEGRERWHTWTELYDQLAAIPAVGPLKAKTFASRWFIERYGYAAGSDLNRVKHGKAPRGKRVGPG